MVKLDKDHYVRLCQNASTLTLKQRVEYTLSKAYDAGGSAYQRRVMQELQDAGIIRVESKPWMWGNLTVWSVCYDCPPD